MRLKYNLLQLFRTKENLFWGMGLPLAMGILFYVAFGGLEFELDPIPVAIVESRPLNILTRSFVEMANYLEEDELLSVSFTSYENAMQLLRQGEIAGIVLLGETIELILMRAGIGPSILETIAGEFIIRFTSAANIASLRPEFTAYAMAAIESYESVNAPVRELPISVITNFFFVMLAVGCFMGSSIGVRSGFELQAQMTDVAARLSIAPTPKIILFLENLLTGAIGQTLITTTTLLFYTFILGVDFGDRWGLIFLATVFGSFTSVAFGMFFSIVIPGKEEAKELYLTVISQAMFLAAGMMSVQIRNIVRNTLPILDQINIVAIISDTFLTLVIHEDLSRYIQQLAVLSAIALFCIITSTAVLRRRVSADL